MPNYSQPRDTVFNEIGTDVGQKAGINKSITPAVIDDKLKDVLAASVDSVIISTEDTTIADPARFIGKTIQLESGSTLTLSANLSDLKFSLSAKGSNGTLTLPNATNITILAGQYYIVHNDGADNYQVHQVGGSVDNLSPSVEITANIIISSASQSTYHGKKLIFNNSNPISVTIEPGVRPDFSAVGFRRNDSVTVIAGTGVTLLDGRNQFTNAQGAIVAMGQDEYKMLGFTGITPPSGNPVISASSLQPGSRLTLNGNYQASADSGPEGTSLYQWQENRSDGFEDLAGETTTIYDAPAGSNGFQYRGLYRPVSASGVAGDWIASPPVTISSSAPQKMDIWINLGEFTQYSAPGNINQFDKESSGEELTNLIDYNTGQATGVALQLVTGDQVQASDGDPDGELAEGFGGVPTEAIVTYLWANNIPAGEFRDFMLKFLPEGNYDVTLVSHRNSGTGNRTGIYRVQGLARTIDSRLNTTPEVWNNVAESEGEITFEMGPSAAGHLVYANSLRIQQL